MALIKSSVSGVDRFEPRTETRTITLDLPSAADALIVPGSPLGSPTRRA
jgi:hypothetical protein